MFEYKVLSIETCQRLQLEEKMNELASDGWKLVPVCIANSKLIFEREKTVAFEPLQKETPNSQR